MTRRGLLALVVALVLGVVAGGTTALVVHGTGPGSSSVGADPLSLGVPLVDLDCSNRSIIIVGSGDTAAALSGAVADNGPEGVRYLRTAGSCATAFGPVDERPPAYIAYLGPYDTRVEPCLGRMSPAHRGDFVTTLAEGNTMFVKCTCVLPTSGFPDLELGMAPDATRTIWIFALQNMLNDIDETAFPEERATGVYDRATAARIESLQRAQSLLPDGRVDETTWRAVRDRICSSYDF